MKGITNHFSYVMKMVSEVGAFTSAIIHLRIWILQHIFRQSKEDIFCTIMSNDGGLAVGKRLARRRQYIARLFDKSLCPTCKGYGYIKLANPSSRPSEKDTRSESS